MHGSERRILNYWLAEELGHDRLGRVFRAEEARGDRTVVLRLLRVSGVAPADRLAVARQALCQRIRAAAAVVHPSIAKVLDYASHDDLEVLAIEDVQGDTLVERAARGALLPLDEVLWHAAQIAEGVETAHTRGITHGRISPANIRLGRDGRARLLDLGIPRPAEVAYNFAGIADGDTAAAERRRDTHALARTIQFMVAGLDEEAAIAEAGSLPGLGGDIVRAVSRVLNSRDADVGRLRQELVELARQTPADAHVAERTVKRPAARRAPPRRSRPVLADASMLPIEPAPELPASRPEPAPARPEPTAPLKPKRARARKPEPAHAERAEPTPAVAPPEPLRAAQPEQPPAAKPTHGHGARPELLVPPENGWRRRSHQVLEERAPNSSILIPERRSYRHSLHHRLTGVLRLQLRRIATLVDRVRGPSTLQFAAAAAFGALLVFAGIAVLQWRGGAAPSETVRPAAEEVAPATGTAEEAGGAIPVASAPTPAPTPTAAPAGPAPSQATPPLGALRVSVLPTGALVSLDDGPWRPAPVSFIELTPGVHRIRISHDAYGTRSYSVTVQADQTARRTYRLDGGRP